MPIRTDVSFNEDTIIKVDRASDSPSRFGRLRIRHSESEVSLLFFNSSELAPVVDAVHRLYDDMCLTEAKARKDKESAHKSKESAHA